MSSSLKPREVLSVPLFLTLYYLRVQQFIVRMLSPLKFKFIILCQGVTTILPYLKYFMIPRFE